MYLMTNGQLSVMIVVIGVVVVVTLIWCKREKSFSKREEAAVRKYVRFLC